MTLSSAAKRSLKFRLAPALLAPVLGVLLTVAVQPAAAIDGTSPWTVRFRALHIHPANQSDAIPSLAVPADSISVSKKWAPDIDIEYAFNDKLSAELLLTVPQKHSVTVRESALGGPVNIGTFRHLPPTLTVKYRPLGSGTLSPYVGVGLNYTRIWDARLAIPTVGSLRLDQSSFGLAWQVGTDYKLDEHWSVSVDLKYVKIGSDVKLGATRVSHVNVDPVLLAVGAGYRF
jgi:outer membrane protein